MSSEEQPFTLSTIQILDMDDSDYKGHMVTVPGGMQTQFMLVIDLIIKQYKSLSTVIEEYLATLEQKDLRKAMKDDKNKPRPNPFEDTEKLRQFFLYFVKEVVKEKTKFKFHLPETSKEWIEYKVG